jgi:hypothetical protein
VSDDDPGAQAIFAYAARPVTTDNGKITLVYKLEVKRTDGSVVRADDPPRIELIPGSEAFVSCDTGRETIGGVAKTKVLYSIWPQCSTSRSFPVGQDCSTRPPAERWQPNYRFPLPKGSLVVAERTPTPPNCKVHCEPGSETPLCRVATIPASLNRLAELGGGTNWSKALSELHKEVFDETKFPISALRWKQITGVDPGRFGRGADIFLQDGEMGQDGVPSTLPLVFSDAGNEVTADMSIPRLVIGERKVHRSDIVEYLPRANATAVVTIGRPDLNAIYGGAVSQVHLSSKQFVFGNAERCLAVRY